MNVGPFVDFHCHLDLYPDHRSAIAACERAEVFTLAVTTTPKAWPRNHELARATRFVRAALGLHPQVVKQRAEEISVWEEYLPQARYVGEVGLDAGPRYFQTLDAQRLVFEHILRSCARVGGKILSVHSVRSAKMVLDLIEAHLPASQGKVVLHWFTGTPSEARRAVELGCYFSINSEMLKRERGTRLVASLPPDRLLTETDGPFVLVAGQPVGPTDLESTITDLARVRSMQPADMAAAVRGNLKRLISD
jgi:TatD DNase family protein